MELVFEDPPEEALLRSRAGAVKYIDFAIALREHMGRWVVLPAEPPYANEKSAQSAAQNIRRGVSKAFQPKGAYEAVANGTKIHVRYMGSPDVVAGDQEEERPARDIAPMIRKWASDQGMGVPKAGRLPRQIVDAYFREHPEQERPPHLRVI